MHLPKELPLSSSEFRLQTHPDHGKNALACRNPYLSHLQLASCRILARCGTARYSGHRPFEAATRSAESCHRHLFQNT